MLNDALLLVSGARHGDECLAGSEAMGAGPLGVLVRERLDQELVGAFIHVGYSAPFFAGYSMSCSSTV
jgi:hypothetical protein